MVYFIQALFQDQLCRVASMLDELRFRRTNQLVPQFFVDKTLEQLIFLKLDIEAQLDSGDLLIDEPVIRATNIADYNKYNTRFREIEAYRYQVILRYGEREAQFNKVIERIYQELDIPQTPPILTFVSDSVDYYWAFPTHGIIAAPAGEERHLLNLPDLFHEIGHYVYDQYASTLIGDIETKISLHFDRKISEARDQGHPGLETDLKEKKTRWLTVWLEEYVCDMIGAYTTGPAYAWTNFKISSIVSKEKNIYTDSMFHPSDESRMRAVRAILYKEAFLNELILINRDWEQYASSSVNQRPASYASFFPDALIDELAAFVWSGCQNIGLRSCARQTSLHARPLVLILNEAWQKVMTSPEHYSRWEADQVQQIKGE